jgi:hypothetical protein
MALVVQKAKGLFVEENSMASAALLMGGVVIHKIIAEVDGKSQAIRSN